MQKKSIFAPNLDVHFSGFGRSKAKTHLNIRTHYYFHFFCYNEKIICLLVFRKISSSFNDIGYLAGHALDQRSQVLIPQSSPPRASSWPPLTLGCMLWTNHRFSFFSFIFLFFWFHFLFFYTLHFFPIPIFFPYYGW